MSFPLLCHVRWVSFRVLQWSDRKTPKISVLIGDFFCVLSQSLQPFNRQAQPAWSRICPCDCCCGGNPTPLSQQSLTPTQTSLSVQVCGVPVTTTTPTPRPFLSWARSLQRTRWHTAACSSSGVGHRTLEASEGSCKCWQWVISPDPRHRCGYRRLGTAPTHKSTNKGFNDGSNWKSYSTQNEWWPKHIWFSEWTKGFFSIKMPTGTVCAWLVRLLTSGV